MKTRLECMECNVRQVIKVSKLLQVPKEKQEEASRKLFKMLSEITFDYPNPFISGKTWKVISEVFENNDPYKMIKKEYNNLLLSMYSAIFEIVNTSFNPLETALKTAVVGNIIDFGAKYQFHKEDILHRLQSYQSISFSIDHSSKLLENLRYAKSLLYIGDNCGEIVLDKLFIEKIKEVNPMINITFGVRGNPILNDVTITDAYDVKIEEVASIISSGTAIPGTLLELTTPAFQKTFYEADIVIAKGQGNYESLSDTKRDNLYLILMAKCPYVANTIGCSVMDYICIENNI